MARIVVATQLVVFLVAAVPSSSSATGAGRQQVLRISGSGGASALVRVRRPLVLDTGMFDDLGGPDFGELDVPALGFVISRAGDGEVVAGRLRSRVVENELGLVSTLALGPSTTIPRGRYRVTLLGADRDSVVVHVDAPRSVSWQVSEPTEVAFATGLITAPSDLAEAEARVRVRVDRSTFVYRALLQTESGPGVGYYEYCLVRPKAEACPRGTSPDLHAGTGGGGAGSASYAQPGQLRPGRRDALFQGRGLGVGSRAAYVVLTLG